MNRPYDAEDILQERRIAEEMANSSYRQGYANGYRQARIDILGADVVKAEEQARDKFAEKLLKDIVEQSREEQTE